MVLPADRMPEAEVALRFAMYLAKQFAPIRPISVSIDGAAANVFSISDLLREAGWAKCPSRTKRPWQGEYRRDGTTIVIHSRPGESDVVAHINSRTIRAECKKGPLGKSLSSPEYPRLREAIGQLLTSDSVQEGDHLIVAVPNSAAFAKLANKWHQFPLFRRTGIHIALVGRDGSVEGLGL